MVHWIHVIIPLAVLMPSLLMIVLPPRNKPSGLNDTSHPGYSIAEGIGRLGVFVAPVFSTIHYETSYEISALLGAIISLLVYYLGWVRYFAKGRSFHLLFDPMFKIPVPLAVMPVLYFVLASLVLHSYALLLSGVILAIGHIPSSLYIYRQLHVGH